jgi:hypothetical protein
MWFDPYLRRVPILWALRNRLRAAVFGFLQHLASLEGTRNILSHELERQNLLIPPEELLAGATAVAPYRELLRSCEATQEKRAPDPIFITARFRTGSTLLWNLFRHLPATTSYYEPFNERCWFDRGRRGTHVDPKHLNVSEYWSEYDGLDELKDCFDVKWKFQQLYMPEHAWNPSMQRYIEILLERARGRAVLQFNEVDLRLAWLRAKFPAARIVHLYRHPRDQWCSTLRSAASRLIPSSLRQFEPIDAFYLLRWSRDLQHYFPFLSLDEHTHPYELFYQLWKLSYLFGHFHAHYSVAFEEFIEDPPGAIRKMFAALAIEDYDLDALVELVQPIPLGTWRQSPDAGLFESIEARVDATFARYAAQFGADAALRSRLPRAVESDGPDSRRQIAQTVAVASTQARAQAAAGLPRSRAEEVRSK